MISVVCSGVYHPAPDADAIERDLNLELLISNDMYETVVLASFHDPVRLLSRSFRCCQAMICFFSVSLTIAGGPLVGLRQTTTVCSWKSPARASKIGERTQALEVQHTVRILFSYSTDDQKSRYLCALLPVAAQVHLQGCPEDVMFRYDECILVGSV